MSEILIKGAQFDLGVSFEWEKRELFSARLISKKSNIQIEKFVIMIPENIFDRYRILIPSAKKMFFDFLGKQNEG